MARTGTCAPTPERNFYCDRPVFHTVCSARGYEACSPVSKIRFPVLRDLQSATAFRTVNGLAPRLILASASPRRRELLAQLGVPFEVVTAEITEHEESSTDPRAMVAHNAALKAGWVAARHPDAIVLGADTTVFLDGYALNKPRDSADARAMLRRLSGRTHTVFTGLALRRNCDGLQIDEGAASDVTFKRLDDSVIEAYLARVHTLDKAGGYAIQEHGDLVVEAYTGSWTNIVGLPLEATKHILTRAGLVA